MGVSHHSNAVIGVPFDNLYTVKKERHVVTKYNEDTGEPYEHPTYTERYFWGSKEVEECDDREDFVKQVCGLKLVYSAGCETDIVGVELARADPGEVVAVDLDKIRQAILDVKNKLQESGCDSGNVKLHLVSYVG